MISELWIVIMSWKVIFWLSICGGCWAGGDSWLTNIERNLRADMLGVMEMQHVNYSSPDINTTYVSKNEFDMRAMGHLYNSTPIVIDAIVNKDAYPEGIVSVSDGHVELAPLKSEWRVLLAHYAGPVSITVLAALLVAVLPLAGLFWCCCHWCRSGRRRRPFDRKYDACIKGILAIILIVLLTLFLFGVVCAFVTEQQVEEGAAGAGAALRDGARDSAAYLNATQAHARWILVDNYRELENKLNAMLTSCGTTVSLQLGQLSSAVSVTRLYAIVQRLGSVQRSLQQVHNLTARLRVNAEKLHSSLSKVKTQLLHTMKTCNLSACTRLQEKYKLGQLNTEIQYSQMLDQYFPTMPKVTELLKNVTSALESNITAEVGEGQKVFTDIQQGVKRELDGLIPSVQQTISDTGKRLAQMADEITEESQRAAARLRPAAPAADNLDQLLAAYGPYRAYLGRAIAAALLLMVLVLTWGLTCGVCGRRGEVYATEGCCHKPHGARSLLCGMGTMFLLGGLVALMMLLYFLAGVTLQRFVCDPLTEPRDNRLFGDVERFVNLEQREPGLNLTAILLRCHRNNTIYETLQLHRRLQLEELQQSTLSELQRRVVSLQPSFPQQRSRIQILKPSAKEKLARLANNGLSTFNFDNIINALETNLTSLPLEGLATQLEAAAESARLAQLAASLREAAAALRSLHAGLMRTMRADTHTLNMTTIELRDGLRSNYSSQKEAILYLMDETEQAENFLNTQGPELIQNTTREFGQVLAGMVERYLTRAVRLAQQDVGPCAPVSHAYNSTRDALCVNLLMPINGYWMSLAWCLLLFLPILLVSQKLARLYSHADPYPGPLVEAEYEPMSHARGWWR